MYFLLSCTLLAILADRTCASALPVQERCRYLPGDKGWPAATKWNRLNDTVQGRLTATAPIASVCHDPHYDEAACKSLADGWMFAQVHHDSPSSVLDMIAQNGSCDPFEPRSQPCVLGNYVSYSIAARSADDVSAGIKFARDNNIRFVVKNTGHDFLGKSTGAGALGIWTQKLNDITFIDNYHSAGYRGPAARLGSGVTASDVYAAVSKRGYIAVGGSCPTVGLVGGFTQGGGHGPLSTLHGMGADQVLEWDVVLASGRRVTVQPDNEYADLYFALGGGGGGTYAVVLSMTVRIFKDQPQWSSGIIQITPPAAPASPDTYWKAVEAYFATLPRYLAVEGAMAVGQIGADASFVQPLVPGVDEKELLRVVANFTRELDALGVSYNFTHSTHSTFFDTYSTYDGPLPWGIYPSDRHTTGHFVPLTPRNDDKAAKQTAKALVAAMRKSADKVGNVFGLSIVRTSASQAVARNAVHPSWRSPNGVVSLLAQTVWDYKQPRKVNTDRAKLLDTVVAPILEDMSPGTGGYLNEASPTLPSWKQDYYGSNYARLRSIKTKYDPTDLFFGPTAVGSDAWNVAIDGRMCRA